MWTSHSAAKALALGALAIALAFPPAVARADDAADALAAAEALIVGGEATEIWAGFDRAVELFWAEAPLSFRAAVLVDSADGYGQYQPRADNLYVSGDRLIAYLEPVGYGWTAIGDEFRIRFAIDLEVLSDRRGVVIVERDFATLERMARNRSRELQATISLTLPQLPAGDYLLQLTFRDAATGKSATAIFPVTIGD